MNDSEKEEVLELLKKALVKEAHGYEFYVKVAQTCGDGSDTNLVLTRLADEEVKHFGILKIVYDCLQEKDVCLSLEEAEQNLEDFKSTLQQLLPYRIEDTSAEDKIFGEVKNIIEGNQVCDEDGGIKLGIQVEENAILYYKKIGDKTEDVNLKEILKQIIEEEVKHKSVLQQALKGKGVFFKEDEMYGPYSDITDNTE
ncbi:hypothetical protein ACFLRC_00985 [Candidatus Altiarchaeota archaeon]